MSDGHLTVGEGSGGVSGQLATSEKLYIYKKKFGQEVWVTLAEKCPDWFNDLVRHWVQVSGRR